MNTLALVQPRATQLPCVIHRTHQPLVTYSELHHIVPQEWQALWQPPTFLHQPNDPNWPFSGLSQDRKGLYLWDARTNAICRTGHGNVHFYLVLLMRYMSERPDATPDEQETYARTQLRLNTVHIDTHAAAEAMLAVTRFTAAGGSLATLWAAHAWGQI